MAEPDVKAYTSVLNEIKFRMEVVWAIRHKKLNLKFNVTTIEAIALQLRMMTELIALGSLAANREIFEQNRMKFETHWHPRDIMRDLEKINPYFYPEPLFDAPPEVPGNPRELKKLESGYLTKEQLIEVHGRCGNLLHAQNPFRKKHDYETYRADLYGWTDAVRVLLNTHKIRMLEDDKFYLVHMHGNKDGHIATYTFGLERL